VTANDAKARRELGYQGDLTQGTNLKHETPMEYAYRVDAWQAFFGGLIPAWMRLRFLLGMLHLGIENDATDRFMRDSICDRYGAEWFLLLHPTLYDCRPESCGNTIVRMISSWSSVLENMRAASLKVFIFH
jgi:hypothetical protein